LFETTFLKRGYFRKYLINRGKSLLAISSKSGWSIEMGIKKAGWFNQPAFSFKKKIYFFFPIK
jgi:hypothetical protein